MTNIIRLICPNLKCRKILTVPASTRGKTVRCRMCGMRIQVPNQARVPAASSAAPVADGDDA